MSVTGKCDPLNSLFFPCNPSRTMRRILGHKALSQTIKLPPSFPSLIASFPLRPRVSSLSSVAEAVSSEEDASPPDFRHSPTTNVRKHFQLMTRQVKIETEAWENAAREYQDLLEDMFQHKLAPNLPYVKTLFLGWFQPLKDAVSREQDFIRGGKTRHVYSKHFHQLPADMMAVITMHKLMAIMMSSEGRGTARVVACACAIGEAIEQEVRIYTFMEKIKGKKGEEERLRKKVAELIRKQRVNEVRKIVRKKENFVPWTVEVKAKLGSRLLDMFIQTAHIQSPASPDAPPDVRPAFVHTRASSTILNTKTVRYYGVIKCDPLVLQGLDKSAKHVIIPYMPMLVPPLNWAGFDRGAHFFLPSYLMRTHGAKQQREALRGVPTTQLKPIFEALDTLGSTKWRINKRVLRVVDRIWNSGGRIGGLVDRDDVPLPEKPETEDELIVRKWKSNVKAAKKENSERHSLRCDVELKLSVARKMQDEEGFYYPHNVDFRGRAYPMHPYLNHLGSDMCRGVLEFSEGRPLGNSGIKWLKVQIANLVAGGVDKLSFEGRVAFVDSHLDDVFDSAERPLEGGRWWLGAEDPFQCLAACINLTEALKSSSPEECISHIPIHMDGSCNGLQHYAALGRDTLGAESVNLTRGEKPADVYSGIAARVLAIMENDAIKDPEVFPNALRARVLLKEVDRKLVKQTVMTSVYGVTYIGARDQIKRRLKERGTIADDQEIFGAACYAAKVTLTALGEMFEAAREIMNWLGECARIIAAENEPVRWTTPLGLPVVQPYRKMGQHAVRTSLQVLSLKCESQKVMAKRQRTAFAPNFVHSLDGSHMMMTAVACKKAGLRFAGVHDSYWTHACDVDKLNRILREKFVELYEQPILENLSESFETSFPSLLFPPLPERGDFNLKDVLESTYFFN